MARIKVCGECWKPVAECICDDDEPGITAESAKQVPAQLKAMQEMLTDITRRRQEIERQSGRKP